eukprot:scpid111890/ scgid33202/ 
MHHPAEDTLHPMLAYAAPCNRIRRMWWQCTLKIRLLCDRGFYTRHYGSLSKFSSSCCGHRDLSVILLADTHSQQVVSTFPTLMRAHLSSSVDDESSMCVCVC